MRITPLDIRKQEFRRAMRGLDADEVHAFLATVADEYEAALTENKQLREKVVQLEGKVAEFRNMEETLRNTLVTAERAMTEARENARKEAELILRDARMKSDEHTSSLSSKVDALKTQLHELRAQRDSYLARMASLAQSQLSLVDGFRKDYAGADESMPAAPAPAPAPPEPTAARVEQPAPITASAPAPSTPPAPVETGVDGLDELAEAVKLSAAQAEASGPSGQPAEPVADSAAPTPEAPAPERGDRSEPVPAGTRQGSGPSEWSLSRFQQGLGEL